MSSIKDFFSQEQKKAIEAAIVEAEKNTSGEIRVHLEAHCKEDVLDHAAKIFHKLGMDKTKLRNGVLFYIAIKDHKLAVIGDAGINSVVPSRFWDDIKDNLIADFKQGHYTEGLCKALDAAGHQLKVHFPFQAGDTNELSNQVTFDKDH